MVRFLYIFLLVLGLPSSSLARAYFDSFEVTMQNGLLVDAYIIKPAELVTNDGDGFFSRLNFSWEMKSNSEVAAEVLDSAAYFIDQYSLAHGHLNARTLPRHRSELSEVRRGKWPMVVVTKRGHRHDVLLTVALALNKTLPLQSRFPKRVLTDLSGIHTFHDPGTANGFEFPLVSQGSEELKFAFSEDLSPILSRLPWWKGTPAEIKFLIQKKGSYGNLPALAHALIASFGLHRFTSEKMSKALRLEQARRMREPSFRVPLEKALEELERKRGSSLYVRAFFKGLRETLWSCDGFQRFAAVSSLYSQVSEREEETGGSLSELFLRRFRFPEIPKADFLETPDEGTEGIRTRIYQLSFEDFDFSMAKGLNADVLELGRGLSWFRPNKLPMSCPNLIDEFVGRTLRRARMRLLTHG